MAVVAAAVTGVAGLARPTLARLLTAWDRHGLAGVAGLRFEELLTGLCAAVALACCLWLVVVAVLLAAEAVVVAPAAVPPRRLRRVSALVCPAPARRVLLAACGAVVATGLTAATAAAEPSGVGDPGTSSARTARLRLAGLPLPDRAPGAVRRSPTAAATTVTVRRGDSLWAISERLLPASAGDRRVAVLTRALYLRNAGRIGTDPDLIQPATQLRLPPLATQHGKDQ